MRHIWSGHPVPCVWMRVSALPSHVACRGCARAMCRPRASRCGDPRPELRLSQSRPPALLTPVTSNKPWPLQDHLTSKLGSLISLTLSQCADIHHLVYSVFHRPRPWCYNWIWSCRYLIFLHTSIYIFTRYYLGVSPPYLDENNLGGFKLRVNTTCRKKK